MSNNINNTKADVFIPEIWSKEIISATNPKLVLAPLVWRFDSEAKMGDTIHVPSLSNLVANDKVANTDVSLQAPTETNTDILINKHKETSFIVEDITKLQANRDLRSLYTDKASTAIAKQMDSDIAALASGFSQTFGTYNTAITTDVILDSNEQLDLNDVPMEDRAFVYRADVKRDLLDLAAYTSSDFVDGRPVSTGAIGSLYGVQTYLSNNLVKTGNNTNNMLFHKEALALAQAQAPRVQTEYELEKLGWLTVVDTVYGVKEMRDTFGVLVKT
jgi:N4-gp56 family major capsid protein